MRLILSRKGFDSSAGGCPSPVLPDDSLCVLPIPDRQSRIRYDDVLFEKRRLGKIARDLTGGRIRGGDGAHLEDGGAALGLELGQHRPEADAEAQDAHAEGPGDQVVTGFVDDDQDAHAQDGHERGDDLC